LLYRSNPVVIASVRCLIVFRVSQLNLHNDTVESRELNQSVPSENSRVLRSPVKRHDR